MKRNKCDRFEEKSIGVDMEDLLHDGCYSAKCSKCNTATKLSTDASTQVHFVNIDEYVNERLQNEIISKAADELKGYNAECSKDTMQCAVATMDIQTQMEDSCTPKIFTSTGCDPIKFDEMKDDQSETITTRTFKDNCIQTLCNITLITTLVDR